MLWNYLNCCANKCRLVQDSAVQRSTKHCRLVQWNVEQCSVCLLPREWTLVVTQWGSLGITMTTHFHIHTITYPHTHISTQSLSTHCLIHTIAVHTHTPSSPYTVHTLTLSVSVLYTTHTISALYTTYTIYNPSHSHSYSAFLNSTLLQYTLYL